MDSSYTFQSLPIYDKITAFLEENGLDQDVMWNEVPGSKSNYFISSRGNLLSLCWNRPHLLKPFYCGTPYKGCKGYQCVDLKIDGKWQTKRINILVAEAFVPNPDPVNKTICHHINLNPDCNDYHNLIWLTEAEHTAIHNEIHYKKKLADAA